MDGFVGAMRENCFGQEVTNSTRFERAGWLEILELEVDIACEVSGVLGAIWRRLYHPASLESATDFIRGV
jgi:hypothetical protein